jgi:hypothetical protein
MVYTDGVTAYSLTNLWWETTTQDRITSDMIAKTPCPVTIDYWNDRMPLRNIPLQWLFALYKASK